MITIKAESMTEVVAEIARYFKAAIEAGDVYRRVVRRGGIELVSYSVSPVYYMIPVYRPVSHLRPLKTSMLFVQNEIISEWFGINPTLNKYYIREYDRYVKYDVEAPAPKEHYTYGERWGVSHQFHNVLRKLLDDPNTRQGVMVIYGFWDTFPQFSHVPCTILHQFLKYGDRLDVHVYMRSQDLLRGFIHDPVLASFLLQVMARAAGMKPGYIHFYIADLHIYEYDINTLSNISRPIMVPAEEHGFIIDFGSFGEFQKEMEDLLAFEHFLRTEQRLVKSIESFRYEWSRQFARRWVKYWKG